ncbi:MULTISPECIES: hypothetical protein [unclassified Pseudomonas]|uniref:capsular polysaccharide export protein, LipB/KpsS family n=1 Tax=unclassified Pseudomonas TaxID=196821 RepID=UPI0013C4E9FE|nr:MULTISPECIES: hypothetical protein [unclassified Pseudomonas]
MRSLSGRLRRSFFQRWRARQWKDKHSRVFISCWLKSTESVHGALVQLERSLANKGIRLTFVTDAPVLVSSLRLDIIRSGFFVSSPRRYDSPVPDNVAQWLSGILSYERFWLMSSGRPLPDLQRHSEAISDGYHYWLEVLRENRPALMLVWGSTAPLSQLHLKLCGELSIPVLVLERGHFSGTLMLDTVGQFAFGGFGLQPQRVLFGKSQGQGGAYRHYLEWVKSNTALPYASYNVAALSEFREMLESTKKKVILFIGVNDLGTGSLLSSFGSWQESDNPFSSTRAGLKSVIDAMNVVAPNDILLFKPHPSDRGNYADLVTGNVHLAKDVNINFLIENADVCVSLSTTALARVLASDKPLVTLGFTELSQRGVAYECQTMQEVPAMLRAALCRDNFPERVTNGHAYIGSLFENYLIAIDQDVPCRIDMEDLCEFIVERVRHCG